MIGQPRNDNAGEALPTGHSSMVTKDRIVAETIEDEEGNEEEEREAKCQEKKAEKPYCLLGLFGSLKLDYVDALKTSTMGSSEGTVDLERIAQTIIK
jgi:hypothetical protein